MKIFIKEKTTNLFSYSNPYRLNKYKSFIWWFLIVLIILFILYQWYHSILLFFIKLNLFTGFFSYEFIKRLNYENPLVNQINRFIFYSSSIGIFILGLFINIFIIVIILLIYLIFGSFIQLNNAWSWNNKGFKKTS